MVLGPALKNGSRGLAQDHARGRMFRKRPHTGLEIGLTKRPRGYEEGRHHGWRSALA